MQERPNWRNAESDDDESDNPGYGSYKPERPALPPPERPAAPARAPLEGMIWRQNEDLWKSFSPEGSKDKDDDDDDDEEKEKEEPKQPVVAKDKPDSSHEAGAVVQEASGEDAEDEDTAKGEQPDSNVFVYPEEAVPAVLESAKNNAEDEDSDDNATHKSTTFSAKDDAVTPPAARPPATPAAAPYNPAHGYAATPAAEVAGPVTVPEASAPEYYQPSQPTAEAVPPALQGYYEQEAAQPPAIPPELQINQPPLPPIGPPSERAAYAQPPERPADQYAYNPGMYPPQNANEYTPVQSAVNAPAERAPVQVDNHRHGEPLAVAVGLGLVAEHIGRKRGDRKQQKQIDRFAEETRQQQENAAAHYQRTQEQQRTFTAEQQRQAAEMQRMRTAQERFAASPAAPYALENAPSTVQAPQRFEAAAANAPRPLGPIERQPGQQQGPEGQQQTPKTPEQPFEPTPEGMPIKPQQHVERSAWHNIVVDKHGHEVTNAIQYGQEFHRQREHEMLQDRVSGNPTGGGGGGAAAGGGIAGQQQDQPVLPSPFQYPQSTLPSGMTSPALPPGHPSHIDPQHQLPAASKKEVTSNIANPWFWLMLALVIAAFFTAALI
jgi:hypothetical protein